VSGRLLFAGYDDFECKVSMAPFVVSQTILSRATCANIDKLGLGYHSR
jgi:hypothetical protein